MANTAPRGQDFASSLIQSLRQQPGSMATNNPGISYLPNQSTNYQNSSFSPRQLAAGMSFNPQMLSHAPGVNVTPEMRAEALRNHKGEEDPSLTFFSGGGDYSSDSSGSDSIGQGVNNNLADFGLGLMAYGQNPALPGAIPAAMLGYSIAGAQADAMGEAADALGDYDIAGVSTVSDPNGNVYGVSNDDSIAAADAALSAEIAAASYDPGSDMGFGVSIDSGGLMGSGFADAGLDAGYADSISGAEADGGGGGGSSGGGCVIATHAVASGAFTPKEKRKAVQWCVKNLHRTWWGEAIRRGYRYHGRKAINAGNAEDHYQEFKDYVAFATGSRRTPKTALTFAWRSAQFFVTGFFVKD